MSDHIEIKEGVLLEVAADGSVLSEKNLSHVVSGLKSSIKSVRTSDEAKAHAEERIQEIENLQTGHKHHHPASATSATKDKVKGQESESDSNDAKHIHRVAGGLKAALHNPHTGEEKKEELRKRLDEMGVEHD